MVTSLSFPVLLHPGSQLTWFPRPSAAIAAVCPGSVGKEDPV
jgi:hypothetical protein